MVWSVGLSYGPHGFEFGHASNFVEFLTRIFMAIDSFFRIHLYCPSGAAIPKLHESIILLIFSSVLVLVNSSQH